MADPGSEDVLEFGGPERPPGRRPWRIAALVVAGLVVGGLVVHGALSRSTPHAPPSAVAESSAPAYVPDPRLAKAAVGALPVYPGAVPPVGYLDAASRFVRDYADQPGQRIQLDIACAGTGTVRLDAYPDDAQTGATGQVLADSTVRCADQPVATTVSLNAPPGGRYQLVLAAGPATGVLAWRLISW